MVCILSNFELQLRLLKVLHLEDFLSFIFIVGIDEDDFVHKLRLWLLKSLECFINQCFHGTLIILCHRLLALFGHFFLLLLHFVNQCPRLIDNPLRVSFELDVFNIHFIDFTEPISAKECPEAVEEIVDTGHEVQLTREIEHAQENVDEEAANLEVDPSASVAKRLAGAILLLHHPLEL